MGKTKKKVEPQRYKLPWLFEPRLAVEHLGTQKYPTSTKALRELVANAIDAGASLVEISLIENTMGGIASVVIRDNGRGISPSDLRERFRKIGVSSNCHDSHRLGRFGIGRLAVHRIGTLSEWQSISETEKGQKVRVTFNVTADMANGRSPLSITEEDLGKTESTGTWIKISNLRDEANEKLTPARIRNDLAVQFCSFLLGNPGRRIMVQDEFVDMRSSVIEEERETFQPFGDSGSTATMTHVILRGPVVHTRFPAQLLFSGKGVTVAHLRTEVPPSPAYLGIVDCDYINDIVAADREGLIEMDDGFAKLKNQAVLKMNEFGNRRREQRTRDFIEQARLESFYPYSTPPSDAVAGVEQAVYDVVLEKLNESTNIQGMSKRQQEVVFRLLRRALENENLLDVLNEVAKLSDEDVAKFRRVLERTTLECIIKLSSEVTMRLSFLTVLHQLVYGADAKYLKERVHLHKIIEPHCWIFGSQFHLATSDKSFRSVIASHRKLAGMVEEDDSDPQPVDGIDDIPDLFLAATREYPVEPRLHHLLVELKAPGVPLGQKERDQIRRYARTIRDSHQFDKQSTHWDLVLVSAKASDEIQDDRHQKDKPHGVLWEWDNMTVWALEWCEVIRRARDELGLVREHLQQKTNELGVRDYLRENFPHVLSELIDRSKSR